ncbi:hypothetical protein D6C80_09590 [Aureobasidium pullulans]|nr:hypothetical protein D6C80_09590 [Aureobasidium pullulans]
MDSQPRLIDKLPEPSKGVEMEVLLLGMPRTGTISLLSAFKVLGYKPFHGSMMEQYPHLLNIWLEALKAKFFGISSPYGRKEFDKMFDGWNVACNMPGSLLAEDLIKAYPNAKIVLSTRDVSKWQRSMRDSVDTAVRWRTFDWLASWDPDRIGLWWSYHKFQHSLRPILAPNGERQAYLDHYQKINEMVPAHQVLNFSVGEGWEPLCKFLGKDIPTTPFPRVNNKDSFLADRERRWWQMVRIMLWKTSALAVLLLAIFLMLWTASASWRGDF